MSFHCMYVIKIVIIVVKYLHLYSLLVLELFITHAHIYKNNFQKLFKNERLIS